MALNKNSVSCQQVISIGYEHMSLHRKIRSLHSLTFDETRPAVSMNFPKRETYNADNTELDQQRNSSDNWVGRIDEQTVSSSVVKVTSRSCFGHQNNQIVRNRPRRRHRHWSDVNNAVAQPYKRGISPCERPTSIKKCKLDETVSAKILVILAQAGQNGLSDTEVSSLTTAIINATYDRSVMFKPRIYHAGYIHGRYELLGADMETLDWATSIIPYLTDLWEGANIHITYAGPIPKLTKATILIPGDPVAPETFYTQINWLNEDIDTTMWRIFFRNKTGKDGQIINFGIDEDSLSVLAKKNFMLFFGIGHLSIRLCKNQ